MGEDKLTPQILVAKIFSFGVFVLNFGAHLIYCNPNVWEISGGKRNRIGFINDLYIKIVNQYAQSTICWWLDKLITRMYKKETLVGFNYYVGT